MKEFFVPVLGLHCSGSSCTAGVLAHLGIYMGDHSDNWSASGGFEAAGLISVCEATFPFPSTKRQLPFEESSMEIKKHIMKTMLYAKENNTVAGGKYPHLCAMGQELSSSDVMLKPIHINRPLNSSINSLVDRSQRRDDWTTTTPEKAEAVQKWLWEKKNIFLDQYEHLTIEYYDLLKNPRKEIDKIIEYLSYNASEEQIENATNHVQPSKRKFK